MIALYDQLYTQQRKCVHIFISSACNLNCWHCSVKNLKTDSTIISDETIDKIFNYIDHTYCVSPFGGEPFLFPEKLKHIVDKCNEHNIKSEITTNGFWGKDEKMLDFIANDLKPHIINVSIDAIHGVEESVYWSIMRYFQDNPDIYLLGQTNVGYHHEHHRQFEDYGLIFFDEPLRKLGNSQLSNEIKESYILNCECRGIEIRPNGDIYGLCNRHDNSGCKITNIDNPDLELLRKCMNRTPLFIDRDSNSVYDLCGCELVKDYWDDPNYIQNLDVVY
jgi:organic radical activating enzyme